jgi:hypothetical protein
MALFDAARENIEEVGRSEHAVLLGERGLA